MSGVLTLEDLVGGERQNWKPLLPSRTSSNLNGRYPLRLLRGPFSSSCFLSRVFLASLLVSFLGVEYFSILLPALHSFHILTSQQESTA